MELTFEQIRAATSGAVSVEQEADGIHFYRMYPLQAQAVATQNETFLARSRATAGVKLTFRTDSPTLSIDINLTTAGVRAYYSLDVYVDGRLVGTVNNYAQAEEQGLHPYSALPYQYGSDRGTFDLGPGEKAVCLHLPWSIVCAIRRLTLADGASFVPAVPEKKILFYGDSITQGYDARHPSLRYAARIADALGMAEYNKAVGGAAYCPGLAQVKEDFTPDAIVVAYGSNDWGSSPTSDCFRDVCRQMYGAIRSNYPHTPVFALAPILRHTSNEYRPFGAYCKMAQIIREVADELPGITFIDCLTFVPKSPKYFGDGIVHPTDRGFEYYFKGLYPQMKAALKE